jgi:hypothetical protein
LSPTEIVLAEGGVAAMLSCIQRHEDQPLLISTALDALYNVIDENTCLDILKLDVINFSFNTLSRYDYDRDIGNSTVQLLTAISSLQLGLMEICGESGDRLSLLLEMVEAQLADEELLVSILQLLMNVFCAKETREMMGQAGGVSYIFTALSMHEDKRNVVEICIGILSRLSTQDSLSEVNQTNLFTLEIS